MHSSAHALLVDSRVESASHQLLLLTSLQVVIQ